MKVTEKALWQVLRRADNTDIFRRIETGETGRGVADITYVHRVRTGWIELKVMTKPFVGVAVIRPRQPFKIEQYAWLALHDTDMHQWLKSYLLIGAPRGNSFDFVLMRPKVARFLVEGSKPVTLNQLLLCGAEMFDNATDVVAAITQRG